MATPPDARRSHSRRACRGVAETPPRRTGARGTSRAPGGERVGRRERENEGRERRRNDGLLNPV